MKLKVSETEIVEKKTTPSGTLELAEYLETLGSTVRLAILKLLQTESMDIERISHMLWKEYGKTSSRENTKNHVDKLLSLGLVAKKPGIRDNRAVINYAMVPGSIETAMRKLSKFMKFNMSIELNSQVTKVQEKISEEFSQSFARIRILGGVEDGKEMKLTEIEINIGRIDPEKADKFNPKKDIALNEEYSAVSRVWRPHARLLLEGRQWFIEHCEGKNETYLWEKKLIKNRKEPLKDGDMISLAEGAHGVRFVFLAPKN